MVRWTPLTILGISVLLALVFAARDGAFQTEGPLGISEAFGGGSIGQAPAGDDPWVTFGAIMLCAKQDEPIRLRDVRVDGPVRPSSTKIYLRTVPPVWLASDGALPDPFTPVGTLRGLPPDFDDPDGPRSFGGGRWSTDLNGAPISQPCDDQARLGHGYTELLVAMRAGPEGAEIRDVWVDYEWDHHRDTAHVAGSEIICGHAITEPGICGNPDEFG